MRNAKNRNISSKEAQATIIPQIIWLGIWFSHLACQLWLIRTLLYYDHLHVGEADKRKQLYSILRIEKCWGGNTKQTLHVGIIINDVLIRVRCLICCLSVAICACAAVYKLLCFGLHYSHTLSGLQSVLVTQPEFETLWVWKYNSCSLADLIKDDCWDGEKVVQILLPWRKHEIDAYLAKNTKLNISAFPVTKKSQNHPPAVMLVRCHFKNDYPTSVAC